MKENEQQLREADDERIRISKERSELSRSYDNLKEKVETLRSQLTKSEAKTREFESELLMVFKFIKFVIPFLFIS